MKNFRRHHHIMQKQQDPHRQRRLSIFLPLAILLILFFQFSGLLLQEDIKSAPHPLLNLPVPVFTLASLNTPPVQMTNEALNNTAYLINTFASWCVMCKLEHRALVRFAKNNDVPIIGIAYNDSRDNIERLLKEKGNPYTFVMMDPTGKASATLQLKKLPTTMAVNANGLITFVHEGRVKKRVLETMVQHVSP
jgi:cytochrome c biogenesis protein CcmG/thiol:disulfide interchange protein DsbE